MSVSIRFELCKNTWALWGFWFFLLLFTLLLLLLTLLLLTPSIQSHFNYFSFIYFYVKANKKYAASQLRPQTSNIKHISFKMSKFYVWNHYKDLLLINWAIKKKHLWISKNKSIFIHIYSTINDEEHIWVLVFHSKFKWRK